MSTTSRSRHPKRPTGNARLDLKQFVAARGDLDAKVSNEPGHANLGLVPPNRRHGQYLAFGETIREKKGTGLGFGGVSKAERKRRKELLNESPAKRAA
jgi:hypothetical protein